MPLTNCEVNLILMESTNCLITSMTKREVTGAQGDNPVVFDNSPTNAMLAFADAKLYVPVVAQDDRKLLQLLKTGFNHTIKWKKCRSEMSNQTRNNNLNSLIDSTFNKSIDYLRYHLKMKIMEHRKSIIQQLLRLNTLMFRLTVKVTLTLM